MSERPEPVGPNERLKRMREDARITQRDLASLTNIPQPTISGWESGAYPLTYGRQRHRSAIEQIAKALGRDPAEVWREPSRDGYQQLPFGGDISVDAADYAGALAGGRAPIAQALIRASAGITADEILEVSDSVMAPRILNGWKIAVEKGKPREGRICLIIHDDVVRLAGLYRQDGEWWVRTDDKSALTMLRGEILGLVVAAEGSLPGGSTIVEESAKGLPFDGPRYA